VRYSNFLNFPAIIFANPKYKFTSARDCRAKGAKCTASWKVWPGNFSSGKTVTCGYRHLFVVCRAPVAYHVKRVTLTLLSASLRTDAENATDYSPVKERPPLFSQRIMTSRPTRTTNRWLWAESARGAKKPIRRQDHTVCVQWATDSAAVSSKQFAVRLCSWQPKRNLWLAWKPRFLCVISFSLWVALTFITVPPAQIQVCLVSCTALPRAWFNCGCNEWSKNRLENSEGCLRHLNPEFCRFENFPVRMLNKHCAEMIFTYCMHRVCFSWLLLCFKSNLQQLSHKHALLEAKNFLIRKKTSSN